MAQKTEFSGNLVMVGFGSIGKGVLPLLLKHITLTPERLRIVTKDTAGLEQAAEVGVATQLETLTPENYRQVLQPLLKSGDMLLNLSVDVSSLALVELAAELGCLYLDTCIEPWPGGYTDASLHPSLRSNYGLWNKARDLRAKLGADAPTAVMTHGANPGLVSHFVKQALLNLASDLGGSVTAPADRAGWAALAQRLGVKVIHIAERDTQVSPKPKEVGEFVNTWSIDGFISEGCQPAELGWGTHERHLPADGGRHDFGPGQAVYLNRPGAATRVRTWTPIEGPFHAWLITHGESISIPHYLSVEEGGEVVYRPTVHYAYHPCDAAILSMHEIVGKNFSEQKKKRLIDRTRSPRASTSSASCWPATSAAPTGLARSSRTTRPRPWRRTTAPPRCRSPRRPWPGSAGRSRTRSAVWWTPTRWTMPASWNSACPTWGRWSESTATGRRCRTANGSSRKTSTGRTPGSSRMSASFE